jgi:hypothetical protein
VRLKAADVRAWIRGVRVPPMLPDVSVDYRQIPRAELENAVERWLMREWNLTPLTHALMADEFKAAVARYVDQLRNPKQEDDDG